MLSPFVEVGVGVVVLEVVVVGGGRIRDDETMPSTANSVPPVVVRGTRESRLLLLPLPLLVAVEVAVEGEAVSGSLP